MDEDKTRTDKWGIVISKQYDNGRWYDWKRITPDGYEFLLHKPQTEDYIQALRSCGVTMAQNEMKNDVWVNGRLLTDAEEARILNMMEDKGMKVIEKMRRVMLDDALTNRFHPLKQYLDGLKWDGRDRLTSMLDCFTFNNDTEWARSIIRKWLIGAVAKVYQQTQLFMLVLDGSQGCGKSYWAHWLCPLPEFFIEGAIMPGMKDTDLDAISKWIWEVSELQSTTRRSDREALKAHITKQIVTVRAPYGRYSMTKPVTACYVGTINQDAGFLEDDSGNRRFVIVKVEKLDWSYAGLDVDQLWAQIVTLYRDDEKWDLTADEAAQRDDTNTEYDAPSPVVEMFLEYYQVEPGLMDEMTATMDILLTLETAGLSGNQRANMMKLTTWLKRQGLDQAQVMEEGQRRRGFYGIKQVKDVEETVFSKNGKSGYGW
jgi:predicted P-loop ATPase